MTCNPRCAFARTIPILAALVISSNATAAVAPQYTTEQVPLLKGPYQQTIYRGTPTSIQLDRAKCGKAPLTVSSSGGPVQAAVEDYAVRLYAPQPVAQGTNRSQINARCGNFTDSIIVIVQ